jgi:peptidoglycan/xylan/chitin deacetylase (PgdA/CDA1 family)
MFRELGFAPSLLVNTVLYETAPGLIEAFRQLDCAVVSHGRTNAEAQLGLEETAECALIREARDTIAHHEGKPPRGWLGPWISETERTPDLLHEAGFHYALDWAMDDQPVWLRTRGWPAAVGAQSAGAERRECRGAAAQHRAGVCRDDRGSV